MRLVGIAMLTACSFAPHTQGTNTTDDASRVDGTVGVTDAAAGTDATPHPDAPGLATVSYVQGQIGTANNSSSLSISLLAPSTVHDLDVFGVSWDDDNVTVVSVTDGDGNAFTEVGLPLVVQNTGATALFVAPDIHAGVANQITITFSNNVDPVGIVGEYRGLARSNPVDGTNQQTSFSTDLDSGGFTTQHAHDLIVGFGASFASITAGNGFTPRFESIDMLEDEEVTASLSAHATGSVMFDNRWLIEGVALKAAD